MKLFSAFTMVALLALTAPAIGNITNQLRTESKFIDTCANVTLPYAVMSQDAMDLSCMLDTVMGVAPSTFGLDDDPNDTALCYPPGYNNIATTCPSVLAPMAWEVCSQTRLLDEVVEDMSMSFDVDMSMNMTDEQQSEDGPDENALYTTFCDILQGLSTVKGRECLDTICTQAPTESPTTVSPPTESPTTVPAEAPSVATAPPSMAPMSNPSIAPVSNPSELPSALPSLTPSAVPVVSPSGTPSQEHTSSSPSEEVTAAPSAPSTMDTSNDPPTKSPTPVPSKSPSSAPSNSPSATLPTKAPTMVPSRQPSSVVPSESPTSTSSQPPSSAPSTVPSSAPSFSEIQAIIEVELVASIALDITVASTESERQEFENAVSSGIVASLSLDHGDVQIQSTTSTNLRRKLLDATVVTLVVTRTQDCFADNCVAVAVTLLSSLDMSFGAAVTDGTLSNAIQQEATARNLYTLTSVTVLSDSYRQISSEYELSDPPTVNEEDDDDEVVSNPEVTPPDESSATSPKFVRLLSLMISLVWLCNL